jgi:thymidine phosphorylase
MLKVIQETGGVICAAGAGLAPADKKLYALRDVTATVEAIPLIASSIMSKKIAEGTGSLVLDVKTGSGAFMSDPAKARELATVMVEIGKSAGVNIRALITAMDVPLGLTAGNALEVRESVEVLAGGGPSDVVELTVLLAREMLELAGIKGVDPADNLKNGKAMDHCRKREISCKCRRQRNHHSYGCPQSWCGSMETRCRTFKTGRTTATRRGY